MSHQDLAHERDPLKGMLICLAAYFFVALVGIFEKPIKTEVPIITILFFQSFICLLLIIPESLKKSRELFKVQQPFTYLVRIFTGVACYGVLFYLIRFMPISEAFLYQYSGSLWIPFIMFFWLNVRMERKLWWGIILGFIGVALMLKPGTAMFSVIAFLGILCAILQAISVVAVRKLSVTEPIFRVLFYYFLIGTLITGIMAIKHWVPLTLKDLLFLFGVGVNTYIAQKLVALSLKYAHASTLAPITYVSILFTGFFGWWFWYEIPSKITLLGMVLVITGCLLTILMNRKTKIISAQQPIAEIFAKV